jgi:hypothetical protein
MRILLIALGLVLVSCSRDSELKKLSLDSSLLPEFQLNIIPLFNGQPILPGSSFYTSDSIRVFSEELKLYLSEVTLINENGNEVVLTPLVLLDLLNKKSYQAKINHNRGNQIVFKIPSGNYSQIYFKVGIPSQTNFSDPTLYKSNNPLSINQGMYWDWNSGYRFFVWEAKVDSGNEPKIPMAYHLGLDTLLTPVSLMFSDLNVNSNQELHAELDLELDLGKILMGTQDTINPVLDPFTHTAGNFNLAWRIRQNLRNAWKARPV